MENPLKVAQLFYRTSPASRSHPSFQRDEGLLPPFALPVLNEALHNAGLVAGIQIFHVAEGEADGYCVSLAEELGAFVLGNDSDFAILGASHTETGYRGFVPIEMVQWILTEEEPASASTASTIAGSDFGDEDGFTVKRSKRKTALRGLVSTSSTNQTHVVNGLAPPSLDCSPFPDAVRTLTFVMPSFSPSTLSQRLRIPPTHLRLLASLLGTDHSPPEAPALFFDNGLRKSARIEHAANVIKECLVPGAAGRLKRKRMPSYATPSVFRPRAKDESIAAFTEAESGSAIINAGDELYSFISLVVQSMLLRPLAKDEMLHDLVISLIEATCHYILPSSPTELGIGLDKQRSTIAGYCCATFPYCDCHPVEQVTTAGAEDTPPTTEEIALARRLYARARNTGHMHALSAYTHSDRSYLHGCLADPEGQPLRSFEEASEIRIAAWEIMLDALRSLPCEAKASTGPNHEQSETNSKKDDISPGTSDEGLTSGDATNTDVEKAVDVHEQVSLAEEAEGQFYIVDYLRSGSSTRLTEFYLPLFTVPNQHSLVTLRPPEERFGYLMAKLGLDQDGLSKIPRQWAVLVAIVRLAVTIHANLAGKRKIKLLTQKELRRMVIAGVFCAERWEERKQKKKMRPQVAEQERLILENRNCHIVALVTSSGQEILQLAQALRLHGVAVHEDLDMNSVETVADCSVAPYHYIEGTTWHRVLCATQEISLTDEQKGVVEFCVQAVVAGLQEKVLGWRTAVPVETRPISPAPQVHEEKKIRGQARIEIASKRTSSRYGLLTDV
jgi:hypothetical protein